MEHQSLSGMIYGLVKFFLLSFLVSTVLLQTQGSLSYKLCSLKTWIVSSIYPFHRLLMISCWTCILLFNLFLMILKGKMCGPSFGEMQLTLQESTTKWCSRTTILHQFLRRYGNRNVHHDSSFL